MNMQTLTFFDCSCRVGRRGIINPGSFYKTEDLLDKMNHNGIRKALVYHSMAREYDPQTGNEMLQNEIENTDRLVPVWVVLPHYTLEFPEPVELMEQMKQNGIQAVRMFPSSAEQNYSMAEWNCGPLLSTLEQYRIPLLIGLDQLSWNEWYEVCEKHPELPIILTDVNYRIDRNLYPMLNRYNNLYLETIGYKVNYGIEEICRQFGAERLVFGSGMPIFAGSAAVSMIHYAMISDEEKSKIAGGNLELLLKGVRL